MPIKEKVITMNLKELEKVGLKPINDVDVDKDIDNVYVSDLLSYVMAHGEENTLWLTVLKHVNIIAVAQLHDFAGIIFVQDSYPNEDTIQKANEFDIPLFVSEKEAFEVCRDLVSLGL